MAAHFTARLAHHRAVSLCSFAFSEDPPPFGGLGQTSSGGCSRSVKSRLEISISVLLMQQIAPQLLRLAASTRALGPPPVSTTSISFESHRPTSGQALASALSIDPGSCA